MIYSGCQVGGISLQNLNISTKIITYSQYDPESFDSACKELLAAGPSGVILPPLFKNAIQKLTSELVSREIPYVYVDIKLDDPYYFAYFGMPMYQSGYLCAALLTERLPAEEVRDIVVVRIIRDKTGQSDPTVSRREGFINYITDHFPYCNIINIFIDPANPETIGQTLAKITPDMKLVVMFQITETICIL